MCDQFSRATTLTIHSSEAERQQQEILFLQLMIGIWNVANRWLCNTSPRHKMSTAVFIFKVFYMLLQYKLGWLLFKHVLLFVIYVFQSYLMPFYSVEDKYLGPKYHRRLQSTRLKSPTPRTLVDSSLKGHRIQDKYLGLKDHTMMQSTRATSLGRQTFLDSSTQGRGVQDHLTRPQGNVLGLAYCTRTQDIRPKFPALSRLFGLWHTRTQNTRLKSTDWKTFFEL